MRLHRLLPVSFAAVTLALAGCDPEVLGRLSGAYLNFNKDDTQKTVPPSAIFQGAIESPLPSPSPTATQPAALIQKQGVVLPMKFHANGQIVNKLTNYFNIFLTLDTTSYFESTQSVWFSYRTGYSNENDNGYFIHGMAKYFSFTKSADDFEESLEAPEFGWFSGPDVDTETQLLISAGKTYYLRVDNGVDKPRYYGKIRIDAISDEEVKFRYLLNPNPNNRKVSKD